MKKRFILYGFQFSIYIFIIYSAVFLYFSLNNLNLSFYSTFNYVMLKKTNFVLILLFSFFFSYLSGILESKSETTHSFLRAYFLLNLKFILVTSMVSFIEFFLFFNDKVGRFIYIYIIILFSIYSFFFLVLTRVKKPMNIVVIDKSIYKILKNKFQDLLVLYNWITYEDYSSNVEKFKDMSFLFIYYQNFNGYKNENNLVKQKIEGVKFLNLVNFLETELERIPVEFLNSNWIINEFKNVSIPYLKIVRLLNISFSVILLAIFFPIGLLFSVINKLIYGGTIFYKQERVGKGGIIFNLIKFRTMVSDAEKNGPQFTSENDSRITSIGRIMRKLRLDETPQLFNVLRGEMNLIGPRPEREVFIKNLEKDLPYYKLRQFIKPGITGWAQVKYSYASENIIEQKYKFEFDLFYIKNRSIFLDILILIKTIKSIFNLKGK